MRERVLVAMSGGVAYVLDVDGSFPQRCNQEMVDLEPLASAEDIEIVRTMLRKHVRYTNSGRAVRLLADWQDESARFVKIIPRDYKRVLLAEWRARQENREPAFAELVGAAHG